ncbi:MAG: hypothetical protein ABIJ16_05120, partial [Bacteroidota bacterium]
EGLSYPKPGVQLVGSQENLPGTAYVKNYPLQYSPTSTETLQNCGANYLEFYLPSGVTDFKINFEGISEAGWKVWAVKCLADGSIFSFGELSLDSSMKGSASFENEYLSGVKKVVLIPVSTKYSLFPLPMSYKVSAGGSVQIQSSSSDIGKLISWPNPVTNNNLTIGFSLDAEYKVWLKMTDSRNRIVESIIDGEVKNLGSHNVSLDIGNLSTQRKLANGVYFLKFKATNDQGWVQKKVSKVVILR